jgi:hypothetical protein
MDEEANQEAARAGRDAVAAPAAQKPDGPEFDAFISYRRSDGAWAAHWLRRNLERTRLPPELERPGRRPLRCYIDVIYRRSTDDFFLNNIVPNLKQSRYLILIATPDALKRRTDGQPNWVGLLRPGEDELITVHGDHGVRVWDFRRGHTLGKARQHSRAVLAIQTSRPSDGAAGVRERAALRVFDGRTGQPLSGLMVPDGLNAAAFSADGRLVVTCGRRLQSWDAETGMAIGGGVDCGLSEFIHIGPLGGVAFSGTQGSTVGLVNLRPVREPAAALRRQAEVEGILRLDETTGAVQPLSKEVWEARRREPVAAAPGLALPIAGHDTKY